MSNIINRDTLKKLILKGQRIDGRELLQNRDIKVTFGPSKTGAIEINLGDTKVFSTTKASIVTPHIARQSEGFLKFKVDINVVNEEAQGGKQLFNGINPDNAKTYSMELEKIIERVIKGSKALDTESLCIQSGKSVWSVQVDTIVLNNDGNLIDTVYLATLLSLLHFRRPQVQILPQNGIKVYLEQERRFMPLSIHHIPLTFTFGILEEGENSSLGIDPSFQEEIICNSRITVALNIYGDICYIHKPGGMPISHKLISQIIQVCLTKVSTFTNQLREFLQKSNQITFTSLKDANMEIFKFDLNQITKKEDDQIDIKDLQEELDTRVALE